jgi:hypothetical protein
MKKIIAPFLVIGIAAGVFILAKQYLFKKQSAEVKIENNQNVANVLENNTNQESIGDVKTETGEAKKNPSEAVIKNETKISQETSKENNSNKEINIISKLVSWGYEKSGVRIIDTIIIHSSYNALGGDEYDVNKLISEYKSYGVSPHYLIDRQGKIYQLVVDKNIAYHAGASQAPDGRKSVNNFSIGIELMNTKEDKYTNEQYASLKNLIANLKNDYKIKYVLGHNQIASDRKTDPWNFDWSKL